MVARNRADGSCRVAPDARELQQRLEVERHDAAVFRHDDLGGLLEIARAAVVSEPLPELHELVVRAGCECGDVGERLEEALEIRQHGRDTRLLQHDFRNPDAVRRRLFAPRQHARDGRVPGEQRRFELEQGILMRDGDGGASCFLFCVHRWTECSFLLQNDCLYSTIWKEHARYLHKTGMHGV